MKSDDAPVGRLLSRRQAVALLGTSVAALAGGALLTSGRRQALAQALPSCVARPEQTEGPYFVDQQLNRTDIRSDLASGAISPGVPLALSFLLSRMAPGVCEPLRGAQVDVWHCDALGVYSGVTAPGSNTVGQSFLRGYQVTDSSGRAEFQTIYPGWYQGRTVHIHFKVRFPAGTARAAEFTSQLYFDDTLTDQVQALAPYTGKGQRTVRNANDSIFRNGGSQLLLEPQTSGSGYTATFSLGLQLD